MTKAVLFNNLIELDDEELTEVPMNELLASARIFSFGEGMVWVIFDDYTSLFSDQKKEITHIQDNPEDFPAFLLWLGSDESPLPKEIKAKIEHLRQKVEALLEITHGA
jgi:hypothetical protein